MLHVRDDGQPEGCALQPPLDAAAQFFGGDENLFNAADTVLPVVPMFHVNAWGIPYMVCMMGAKIVFPGPALDGASLHSLIESEGVTVAGGCSDGVAGAARVRGGERTQILDVEADVGWRVACPPAMLRTFQETYGVYVIACVGNDGDQSGRYVGPYEAEA